MNARKKPLAFDKLMRPNMNTGAMASPPRPPWPRPRPPWQPGTQPRPPRPPQPRPPYLPVGTVGIAGS